MIGLTNALAAHRWTRDAFSALVLCSSLCVFGQSVVSEDARHDSRQASSAGSPIHEKKEYSASVTSMHREKRGGVEQWTAPQANPTRVMEQLVGFVPAEILLDRWGGRTDRQLPATGFFYTKKVGDRWWAVDPDGHPYFHMAVDGLGPSRSPQAAKAFEARFGDSAHWMEATQALLLENGFHGAGAWSQMEMIKHSALQPIHPLAYAPIVDFMGAYAVQKRGLKEMPDWTGYPNDTIFVFDPDFVTFADKQAQRMQAAADDPALFGYFSDNELPFKRNNLDGYLALPHEDWGYRAAQQWMVEHHATVPTDQLREEFLEFESDRYFSIVSAAIRRYDKHHMYIGMRITARTEQCPEVFRALGRYADAISVNYYEVWTPNADLMRVWAAASGKPEIISEFYTKAMDSGLPNTTGAGWLVGTQKERGLFYQDYVLALIESRTIVGWQWFTYQDNDPGNNRVDPSNRDANKGIVNIRYEPYRPLLERMRQVNNNAYALADYFDHRAKVQ